MITLYDEQEIMERYVESEVAEAVEKADKEASIRSVIETCQDLGVSIADTITRIVLKFNITQMESEKK